MSVKKTYKELDDRFKELRIQYMKEPTERLFKKMIKLNKRKNKYYDSTRIN